MGVRISWLTLARNSSLARFADSAASLARRNSSSASLPSVMSVQVPNHLKMPPSLSRIGTPRVLNQRYSPSNRRTRYSTS